MVTAIEILGEQDCSGYCAGEVFGEFYYTKEEIVSAMIKFAKMHCEAQAEAIRNNVSLRQSSSEEVNENDIYPFVTASDDTVWIINEDTIINAYPLTNIK